MNKIKRVYIPPVSKLIILDGESDLMAQSQPVDNTFEETEQEEGKSIWNDNINDWE